MLHKERIEKILKGDLKGIKCYLNKLTGGERASVLNTLDYHDTVQNPLDSVKRTLLGAAIHVGNLSIMQFLIEEMRIKTSTICEMCITPDCSSKVRDALEAALAKGDTQIVAYVLQQRENQDENRNRNSTLHHAIDCVHITPDWLDRLYLNTDVNYLALSDTNIANRFSKTPLQYASQKGYCEKITWLLQQGAQVDGKDDRGMTAVYYAAAENRREAIALLFEQYYAQIDIQDKAGNTPLHVACEKNHFEVSRYLLKKGVRVHVRNAAYNKTPLHYAALHAVFRFRSSENSTKMKLPLFQLLFKHGAPLYYQDGEGNTPLDIVMHGITSKKSQKNLYNYLIERTMREEKFNETWPDTIVELFQRFAYTEAGRLLKNLHEIIPNDLVEKLITHQIPKEVRDLIFSDVFMPFVIKEEISCKLENLITLMNFFGYDNRQQTQQNTPEASPQGSLTSHKP